MNKWNNNSIKEIYKELQKYHGIDIYNQIKEINKLQNNKSNKFETRINNLIDENKEYQSLKKYDPIIKSITEQDHNIGIDYLDYGTIKTNEKKIIDNTEILLSTLNKDWLKTIKPYISDINLIDIKRNNETFILYINKLKKFLISLSINDNISDYILPIHEYLHIYQTIINEKSFNNIDSEFLSIFGELITIYEMKKNNLFFEEPLKYEINNYIITINHLKSILYKKEAILENIPFYKKTNYLSKLLNIKKSSIKDIYSLDLTYNYSSLISYYIALELFAIYKNDKEKAFYLCNALLTSNDKLENKLKNYNINLLENSNNYVKTLKKEYNEKIL